MHAALERRRGRYQTSDAVYQEFAILGEGPWQSAARGEVWALGSPAQSPKPVLRCHRTPDPPHLDGLLGDPIWQEADEVRLRRGDEAVVEDGFIGSRELTTPAARNTPHAIVMLAYDDEYLYLAASVPRRADLPTDPTEYPGRTHDADLVGFDQLSLQIDTDRDYATFYQFEVDSRAQTRDVCWTDQRYNPKWHVASDADDRRWTIEAAIPLEELVAATPQPLEIWAIGISRVRCPPSASKAGRHPPAPFRDRRCSGFCGLSRTERVEGGRELIVLPGTHFVECRATDGASINIHVTVQIRSLQQDNGGIVGHSLGMSVNSLSLAPAPAIR